MNEPVSPRTFELWCARLLEELNWLYEDGKATHYRWVHSGIDGLKSSKGIRPPRGSHSDGPGARVSVSQWEKASQATSSMKTALKAVQAARKSLETGPAEQAGEGPRFLTSRQLNELHAIQARRNERGGFGAS